MELPTDLIDLKLYLDAPTREAVRHLYNQMSWELEPPDAWIWRFADVCALYFRAEPFANDLSAQLPHLRRRVHQIVHSAISDYLEDEYA